jgi:5-methylcytosine-specific restriction endonuclease McrA
VRRIHDWRAIQKYHDQGQGFVECQKHFGFSHTAWIKAIKRGELQTTAAEFPDRRRRYDWSEVQAYYDEGHSFRLCRLDFGFCAAAWDKARKRGEIKPRTLGMPLERLLVPNGGSRRNVKIRLLRSGVIQNRCVECGLSEWRGKPLSIHIDHINGVKDDHRLENLRMLCPNCHSQTDTYGARNRKRRRILHDHGRTV